MLYTDSNKPDGQLINSQRLNTIIYLCQLSFNKSGGDHPLLRLAAKEM